MTPKRSRFQTLLPFALPVLLALVACLLVLNGGNRHGDDQVRVEANHTEASTMPRARGGALSETVGIPVARLLREQPPSDVRVASLLQSFEAGDGKVHVDVIKEIAARQEGKRVSFSLGGMDLSGVIESKKEELGAVSMAVRLDDELGRFTVTLRPGQRVYSSLFFEGEAHAFTFHGYPQNDQWTMALKSVDHLLCAPVGSTYPPERNTVGMLKAKSTDRKSNRIRKVVGAPPDLESDPESPFVIYIDLDGEVIDQPEWTQFNGGLTITALPHPRADDVEFVTRVWERVSEDFAPFDINVTTSRTVFDAASPTRRMMCIATPTDDAMPGSGGVAYLNSFGSGLVCWAFNLPEAPLADTVSHEIGHTLGLSHDGKINVNEYYGGHGSGEVSWAPIMGAYFADIEPPFVDEQLTQWSKGEYPDATNQEDDLQMITSLNGFGYRDDDHGNDSDAASVLNIEEEAVNQSGVIERNTDDDWFAFATSGGDVTINANTTDVLSPDETTRGSNLALSLTIYDGEGNEVALDNPEESQGASITSSLSPGNYFIKISGEGRRDLATGFSDYASLGNYFLSGTIPQSGLLRIEPPQANIPRSGGAASFSVITDRAWSWETDVQWIKSESLNDRTGNGEVRYRVTRNPNREEREARIVVRTEGYETFHLVKQAGSASDDHGDTFRDATTVTQVSTTPGELEEPLDVDMFRIEVEGFGDLTVRTTGNTDTFGQFYDASGVRLSSDDDWERPNFSMTQRVSTGVYYVAVRHSVRGGVGPYNLVCSFKNKPALIIDPHKRKVGPSGGRFLVGVISNTNWTWSTDVPWIKSPASNTQNRGQQLAYTVDPHNGTNIRKGRIIFRNKGNRVVHEITQTPAAGDDHSDQRATATELAANGRERGVIQFEGDADMFRIHLASSGTLDVKSIGKTDTVGELLDEKGNMLMKMDDGNGDNFQIQEALSAGVYFLRVTAFGGAQVGAYRLVSRFNPSTLVDVVYTAGQGGKVRGPAKQSVTLGANARTVVAVPRRGYSFARWSDGLRSARRTDLNLVSHVNVTAEFVGTVEVSTRKGKVKSRQVPPVDFGSVSRGKSRAITFTIRNQGAVPLTNLRVQSAGFSSRNWRVSKPGRTTIQPGKRATFRVVLRGVDSGFYSTQWAIRATGMQGSFIVRTMGVVESSTAAKLMAKAPQSSPRAVPDGVESKSSGLPLALPWIDVSPDGYFRYRFERPASDSTEQLFWISSDGVAWEEALVLDVWKTHATKGLNHFEAVFAPPIIPSARILVNESAP